VPSHRNEHLDRAVSVTAHDLRNPLNAAAGFLELARETGDEGQFEKIAELHERMETLIEELLTRTGTGETAEDPEPVRLAELAETAWKTARTEGAELTLELSLGTTMDGDPDLLRHVLENLFRNDAEHNELPVTVTVGTLDAIGVEGFVGDDERGIPQEDRGEVFDHGNTIAEDGTGLGLSIVREFAGAHGWEIAAVQSRAGGARFEIDGGGRGTV